MRKNNLRPKRKWSIFFTILGIAVIGLAIYYFATADSREKKRLVEREGTLPSIKIILLNGCGFQGITHNVEVDMKEMNIEIIGRENAHRFIYDQTLIVVKTKHTEDLERLKRMTGISNVIYAVNDSYPVPYLIILGKDYTNFFPEEEQENEY